MRMPGVEPGSQAWEACMMPLHYMRCTAIAHSHVRCSLRLPKVNSRLKNPMPLRCMSNYHSAPSSLASSSFHNSIIVATPFHHLHHSLSQCSSSATPFTSHSSRAQDSASTSLYLAVGHSCTLPSRHPERPRADLNRDCWIQSPEC